MVPTVLLMLTMEKRFETQPQDYSWWCDRDGSIPLSSVEKRFESRYQEYKPRRDQQKSVEPARQLERNDLVKRILSLIRRRPACECG
jgi:hypothetical protein